MKGTGQKLILISFILSLITAVIIFIYLNSLNTTGEVENKTKVLVAAETIPPRTLIEKKMVKEIEVPNASIFQDYIRDSSKIIGKYTMESILINEGFKKDKLINEGESELSLKIGSDKRALSLSATGATGVSYLIQPGDFVDVVVYLSEKLKGNEIVRPDVAKTVLQNIEVLAVDSQIDRNEKSEVSKEKEDGKAPTTFLVTLSVPVNDIEKLVLAENIGSIKLVLRPLKDYKTNETDGATFEELILDVGTDKETASSDKENLKNNSNENYKMYRVKRGDTLKKISLDFYGDKDEYTVIQEANNIKNENMIVTGEVIKIPILE